jgi:TonB family protein
MSPWRSERLRPHLGGGALTSVVLHALLLFPLTVAAFIWGGEEAERRNAEVDVEFRKVDPDSLPPELLPPEEQEALAEKEQDKEKKQLEKDRSALPKDTPKPLVAEAPKPTPEPEAPPPEELKKLPKVEAPPPEAKPEPPPPPPTPKAHEKMVDLDNDKDEEPPPDAKFLAQKNNRTLEETRATDTNLEKAQKGGEGSERNQNDDEQIGGEKDRIAELEDQKSKLGREAPRVTPHENPELANGASRQQSLLSMRDRKQRLHLVTPETADPSLPRDPEGLRALPEYDLESMQSVVGQKGTAARVRLKLSADQARYVLGEDAEAAERFASKQKSVKKGRYAERMGKIQSALENFIPEVKPGNQTALNTRAAPFAAFIARMHRDIHKLWGFGYLEDLEQKPPSSPYNDRRLMSQLEIVLNADGTIDGVKVIRPSGFTPYDVAAVDTVFSAGPFPDPPREIRSANGKIYLHWKFHRDEHQCATSGVDYYILNNPPAGGDRGGPTGHGEPLERGLPGEIRPSGPKRLERATPSTPAARAKLRELDEAAELPAPDPEATRRATQQVARADDPAARAVADLWFDGYVHGDVARMLRQAAYPFKALGGTAASSARELEAQLKDLVAEAPRRRRVTALQLYSAAGIRGVLGSLPQVFGDGAGLLFAVAQAGGDTFVLVLERNQNVWRATGLIRR